MTRKVVLAHLSDVHLAPVVGFTPRHWNLKRLLGYLNWQGKRRSRHLREVADRLVADALARHPDHIAITGDLVNLGLPAEIEAARGWLRSVGPPELVSVVPGNHDIYCLGGRDPGVARWSAHMASCRWGRAFERTLAETQDAAAPRAAATGPAFPFVRRVGEVAIVGLNSACPTPPARAWGRLGRDQIERAAALLTALGGQGFFRCVLIHHPPLRHQASPAKRLRDARRLERMLATAGAELVLHGHNHVDMVETWGGPDRVGRCLSVGVPSASLGRPHKHEPLARYNLIEIERAGGAWRIDLQRRGLAAPDGEVVEIERIALSSVADGPAAR